MKFAPCPKCGVTLPARLFRELTGELPVEAGTVSCPNRVSKAGSMINRIGGRR